MSCFHFLSKFIINARHRVGESTAERATASMASAVATPPASVPGSIFIPFELYLPANV
jgi:hypothetical protein